MVTLIRLEAEGETLADVLAAIDLAEKKLKPVLPVHDEHYERVGASYRGRRVFKKQPLPPPYMKPYMNVSGNSATITGAAGVFPITMGK